MIDTDQKLRDFLPRLRAAEWIALDTEADSLHAYPEKLCLIQVSIPGADELIDPLTMVMKSDGQGCYVVELTLPYAGSLGYTVRVLPKHELLISPAELGRVVIASANPPGSSGTQESTMTP